jgi:hypothetical protein
MNRHSPAPPNPAADQADRLSLLAALLNRRSRRFAAGLELPAGPLAHRSRFAPVPLTADAEAALAFAAAGITGPALADLGFAAGQGGNIMAGLTGRTIASGDGIQSVALAVTNDTATHLVRRPRELPATELPELINLARRGEMTACYERQRVRIKDGRAAPPVEPLMNLAVNRWAANAAGTTTFVPINDLTLLYINGLLEVFNEHTGAFLLDERAGFRPAGVGKFARSRGGHLEDDPAKGRIATVRHVELMVAEFAAIEQGMMLQNLALMCEALGLGGYPYFANHETAWFEALGFRMGALPASRYLGMDRLTAFALRLLGRDAPVRYPLALEHAGGSLLSPFCPPSFPTMRDAVLAVVERKFSAGGLFSANPPPHAWQAPEGVASGTARISDAAVAATVAYCEYLWGRYGRFPAHLPPFRTVMAFQAAHLDVEFYDRYYRPEALTERHREAFARWSPAAGRKP